MVTPLLIWTSILAVVIIVAVADASRKLHHLKNENPKPLHHFIEMGKEREEVWLPGDPLHDTDSFDDFEDL